SSSSRRRGATSTPRRTAPSPTAKPRASRPSPTTSSSAALTSRWQGRSVTRCPRSSPTASGPTSRPFSNPTGAMPYPRWLRPERSRALRSSLRQGLRGRVGKRTRRKLSKSEAMARVRQRDTLPEVLLRRELWSRGLRYRLNQRIAGTRPDLVFASARLVVFVDGCFWHSCPLHGTTPATNQGFWADKLRRNAERDAEHNRALRQAG